MKIKNQDFLKKENQSLVLELILNQGPISRAEIAKQTTMSPTSASRIVATLLNANLIKEVNISRHGIGRKATYFIPNEDSVISIGVEIDLNQIRIGFMNFTGKMIIDKFYNYQTDHPNDVIDFIGEKIRNIISTEDRIVGRIIGVCVGLPGLIQNDTGVVKLSAQFNWKQVPLKEMLEEKIGYHVQVDNELKLKALAEYVVTSSTYENMIMIGFGSGVGSALITNGEIYRGQGNFSGEIGHTTVDPFGVYCPCGSFGCLQTYIASDFLIAEASKTKPIKTIEELVNEFNKGEKWATNIIDKAATYAAIAINNVVCAYNPEMVVLSGSLIEKHPEIRELIIEKHKKNIWAPLADSFDLGITELKDNGVITGAALSVQRNFIKNIKI